MLAEEGVCVQISESKKALSLGSHQGCRVWESHRHGAGRLSGSKGDFVEAGFGSWDKNSVGPHGPEPHSPGAAPAPRTQEPDAAGVLTCGHSRAASCPTCSRSPAAL